MSEGIESPDTEMSARGTLMHHACTMAGLLDGTMEKLTEYERSLVERACAWSEGYGQGATETLEELRFPPLELRDIPKAHWPFGTTDKLYGWFPEGRAEVHDFKFGPLELAMEVVVPQMEGYVLMAFEADAFQELTARVLHVPTGEEFSKTYRVEDIPALQNSVERTILRALERPVSLIPSELACKYCPGKVRCPAVQQMAMTVAAMPEMTPIGADGLGEMVAKAKVVKQWADGFLDYAKSLMRQGFKASGWELQKRAGRREIRDPKAAWQKLSPVMLPEELVRAVEFKIGELELAFRSAKARAGETLTIVQAKKRLEELLDGVMEKGPGSESLVAVRERVVADRPEPKEIENE